MGQWLPDSVEEQYNKVAGVTDHLAGSTDEAVGRQFDDTKGGGFTDPDAYVGFGEDVLDVPADAINATTGTGENLGWFGVVDRKLDPRSWDGEEPDWAEPSERNDGISGFFAGATQVGGHVTDEATRGAAPALFQSPKLLALLALFVLSLLAPYADLAASATGGTNE